MEFVDLEMVSIKDHPTLNERWVQDRIAENPKVLNLGDVVLRDRERVQPRAGRLDLLLQDPETHRRYEVEVQLGRTDESHIIRTIEYWDIERKRYPQYDHCAVIIAEEITTRFLNVIGLFNGTIPLIAIQMNAVMTAPNSCGLIFTKILDEVALGLVDEDEEISQVTDRGYWENQATPKTVALTDKLLETVHEFAPGFELNFNKFYIGLVRDGQPINFVVFRPRKNAIVMEARLPRNSDIDNRIEESGLDDIGYDNKWGSYRLRLKPDEIETEIKTISELMQQAFKYRTN